MKEFSVGFCYDRIEYIEYFDSYEDAYWFAYSKWESQACVTIWKGEECLVDDMRHAPMP